MTDQQLQRAKIYAQGLVHLAEFERRGSVADARLILAAITELESFYAMPQAAPNSIPRQRKKLRAA